MPEQSCRQAHKPMSRHFTYTDGSTVLKSCEPACKVMPTMLSHPIPKVPNWTQSCRMRVARTVQGPDDSSNLNVELVTPSPYLEVEDDMMTTRGVQCWTDASKGSAKGKKGKGKKKGGKKGKGAKKGKKGGKKKK